MLDGYDHPKFDKQPSLSRKVINARVRRIVRGFKWAVSEELVPVEVHTALRTVPGLAKGRTKAKEHADVKPAPLAHVEAAIPHLNAFLAGVVRVQQWSGARPGEALSIRLADVDRSGKTWIYRPRQHKTSWRGKPRVIALGPKCRAVLMDFIAIRCQGCGAEGRPPRIGSRDGATCGPCRDRLDEQGFAGPVPRVECQDPEVPLFSPITKTPSGTPIGGRRGKSRVQPSQRNRRKTGAKRRPARRTAWPSTAPTSPVPARRQASRPGSPTSCATSAGPTSAKQHGLDGAQATLGHAHAQTTEIYAEVNLDLASKIAEEMG